MAWSTFPCSACVARTCCVVIRQSRQPSQNMNKVSVTVTAPFDARCISVRVSYPAAFCRATQVLHSPCTSTDANRDKAHPRSSRVNAHYSSVLPARENPSQSRRFWDGKREYSLTERAVIPLTGQASSVILGKYRRIWVD